MNYKRNTNTQTRAQRICTRVCYIQQFSPNFDALSSYSLKGPWRKRIRGGTAGPPAWPPAYGVHDDALYKSTAFTFFYLSKALSTLATKATKGRL